LWLQSEIQRRHRKNERQLPAYIHADKGRRMSDKTEAIIEFTTKTIRASLTRPANTTAYAAGDVLAAADDSHLTFEEAFKVKKLSGSISTARCHSSANVATKADLELWLFHTDITEVGDNEAFAPSDAAMLTLIGVIDFATANWRIGTVTSGGGGNAVCEVKNIGLALRGAGTTMYGVLVHRGSYSPVSGEIFTVDLIVTQD